MLTRQSSPTRDPRLVGCDQRGAGLSLGAVLLAAMVWSTPASAQPVDAASPNTPTASLDGVLARTSTEPPPILGRRQIFYRDVDYGSESIFNPATVVISVGLGFYGLLGEDPLVQRIGSGGALHRLVEAYAHPIDAMRARGSVGTFLSQEIAGAVLIPVGPNVYLHMLGEGMVTRKLEEYYLAHGLSRPASVALAIATMTLSQQLNELTEQQSTMRVQVREGVSRRHVDGADSVADTMFWNIVGMAAFQFDGFAELFHNQYVNLAFWPGQAVIDVRSGRMFNQAELYRTEVKLPGTDRFKLLWIGGAPMAAGLGVSARIVGEHTVGATFGSFVGASQATDIERARRPDGTLWTEDVVKPSVCLFLHWERHGSLLGSLALRPNGGLFNVYPGTVDLGMWRLGMYVDVNTDAPSSAGLTLGYLPVVPGLRW